LERLAGFGGEGFHSDGGKFPPFAHGEVDDQRKGAAVGFVHLRSEGRGEESREIGGVDRFSQPGGEGESIDGIG
jgi:hypothetical protein